MSNEGLLTGHGEDGYGAIACLGGSGDSGRRGEESGPRVPRKRDRGKVSLSGVALSGKRRL